jgi:hypothetical protein
MTCLFSRQRRLGASGDKRVLGEEGTAAFQLPGTNIDHRVKQDPNYTDDEKQNAQDCALCHAQV